MSSDNEVSQLRSSVQYDTNTFCFQDLASEGMDMGEGVRSQWSRTPLREQGQHDHSFAFPSNHQWHMVSSETCKRQKRSLHKMTIKWCFLGVP